MTQLLESKQQYLAEFEPFLARVAANGKAWTVALRKAGLERFEALGFPTQKHEQWLHTSVKAIEEGAFRPSSAPELTPDETARIDSMDLEDLDAHRLVFVNGHLYPSLSQVGDLPKGVKLLGLAEALETERPLIEAHLSKLAKFEDLPFVALNTAYMHDGAVLSVPAGVRLERPVYAVFVTTAAAAGAASHPRLLVVLGENAEAYLVERYVALEDVDSFTNAVAEISVGDNARLQHYKLNQESDRTCHVSLHAAHAGPDSHYDSVAVTLGGRLVRNDIAARLEGEGIESHLNGLYVVDGKRHFDTHTFIDHAEPHCESNELYKGVLDDEATAVFNGKIFVRRKAQKTNAFQANRNLLLSDSARINSEPQLEIFADDVRCTHGSTVGQLDEEAIFYLRSRGINPADALAMLTDSFAGEVIDLIKIDPVREYLQRVVFERFHKRAQS
jgi:Fe-S cluster assembly protein SufD